MESHHLSSTAEQLLSVSIRSGGEVRTFSGEVEDVMAAVRGMCAALHVDEQALGRISDGVRLALTLVGKLGPNETIVFCNCDAQNSGNCRDPRFVTGNPCNVDTPSLERAPHSPGRYFFPEGACTGLDGKRTPGTPLHLNGQRVEIGVVKDVPLSVEVPDVSLSGVRVPDSLVEA
ncbi:MAG: hypothetical protein WCS85_04700 [Candidatus Peribacteraceae bacterium]|jgi:hypothetical protein